MTNLLTAENSRTHFQTAKKTEEFIGTHCKETKVGILAAVTSETGSQREWNNVSEMLKGRNWLPRSTQKKSQK